MTPKEAFNKLIIDKGYGSLHDFCYRNKIDYANMQKRVNGAKQKIEIQFAFKIANILKVPIEKIIEIFYPDEYRENRALIKEEKKNNDKG